METGFQTLDPEAVQDNVFKLIGKDWMLGIKRCALPL